MQLHRSSYIVEIITFCYQLHIDRPLNLPTQFTVRATPFHSELACRTVKYACDRGKVQDLGIHGMFELIPMCIHKKEKNA